MLLSVSNCLSPGNLSYDCVRLGTWYPDKVVRFGLTGRIGVRPKSWRGL